MTPERRETIAGIKVEEYYWAGEMVVYVNNQHVPDNSYDHVCAELRALQADRIAEEEAEQERADNSWNGVGR